MKVKSKLFMACFDTAYDSNETDWSDRTTFLLDKYEHSSDRDKSAMDMVTIALCGYSIGTLIKKAKETKNDLKVIYDISKDEL
jgi:hypothetical protein